MPSFFLDTNVLWYLAGLEDVDLHDFRNRMKASNTELSTTHVQVDESTEHIKFHEKSEKHEKTVSNYQQKTDKALEALNNKGINVSLEDTKIVVLDVSRFDLARFGDEEIEKFYDELRKEIDECQKAKGKPKPLLNIACDATIAVSSLDHDFSRYN